MEKQYSKSSDLECPVCHGSFQSKRHASRCHVITPREIAEARPPQQVERDGRREERTAEPEFFPLVSAAHEFKTPLVVMLGYTDERCLDRKSTRLNSSHQIISYAVFCLKKKKNTQIGLTSHYRISNQHEKTSSLEQHPTTCTC